MKIRNLIHVPGCEARHVGRLVQWDIYNNAALLADTDWLLFYGLKRYIHRDSVDTVSTLAEQGYCTNMYQLRPDNSVTVDNIGNNFNRIEETYDLRPTVHMTPYLAQTGFFSIPRETYIHVLNGYSETLLIQHWVDNEMNTRMTKVPIKSCVMPRGMLRLNSTLGYAAAVVGKSICVGNENCIRHSMNLRPAENIRVETAPRIVHGGFEWIYCETCGTLAVDKEFDYMEFQLRSPSAKAPINIRGVGRNLSRLATDLSNLALPDKLEMISSSHTNPRYLEP